ncbi:MAG TPA: DUF1801 domain-containing protein [Thermoanaerobaculia bacterium]|nr:DUF1801 domain-containing protein [Thermoanaerobaculia bacterium]
MTRSAATTVEQFLDELPDDRRTVITEMRKLIRKHLPKGYAESVSSGMLTYCIPLSRYPDTYNKQPLGIAALAAQKNYYALYLMGAYMNPSLTAELKAAFDAAGKRMDMGKSCLRFKSLDDLPLAAVGKVLAAVPPEKLIEAHESVQRKKR